MLHVRDKRLKHLLNPEMHSEHFTQLFGYLGFSWITSVLSPEEEEEGMEKITVSCLLDDPCRKKNV